MSSNVSNNNNAPNTLVIREAPEDRSQKFRHLGSASEEVQSTTEKVDGRARSLTESSVTRAFSDYSDMPKFKKPEKKQLDNQTLSMLVSNHPRAHARHSARNTAIYINPMQSPINPSDAEAHFRNFTLKNPRFKDSKYLPSKLAEGIYTQLELNSDNSELILSTLKDIYAGLKKESHKQRFMRELAILTSLNNDEFSETSSIEFVLALSKRLGNPEALIKAIVERHKETHTLEKCVVVATSLKSSPMTLRLVEQLILDGSYQQPEDFLRNLFANNDEKELYAFFSKLDSQALKKMIEKLICTYKMPLDDCIRFVYQICMNTSDYDFMIKGILDSAQKNLDRFLELFFRTRLETEERKNNNITEFLRGKSPAFLLGSMHMKALLKEPLKALHDQFLQRASETKIDDREKFAALAKDFVEAAHLISIPDAAQKLIKMRIAVIQKTFPGDEEKKRFSVADLCFLRTISHYFANDLFKLSGYEARNQTESSVSPDEKCFIMLSKVLQQLANGVPFVESAPLAYLNPLLEELKPNHQKFLDQFLV